jgi:hypothetical protein
MVLLTVPLPLVLMAEQMVEMERQGLVEQPKEMQHLPGELVELQQVMEVQGVVVRLAQAAMALPVQIAERVEELLVEQAIIV